MEHHEDTEHSLYGQVRQLECDRRKQEQNVGTLKQQLADIKKKNKLLLNVRIIRISCELKKG